MYLRANGDVGVGQRHSRNEAKTTEVKVKDTSQLYGRYNKPELQKILSLLRLDIAYTRAKGDFLYFQKEGQEMSVLDLLGGYGSTILGHNHPEITSLAQDLIGQDIAIHAQASIRSEAANLGEFLNRLVQPPRFLEDGKFSTPYVTTLVNTGTEAIEAAIKHALMEWHDRKQKVIIYFERARDFVLRTQSKSTDDGAEIRPESRPDSRPDSQMEQLEKVLRQLSTVEPVLIALEGAFHGKTAGSISATFDSSYSQMYVSRPIKTHFLKREASIQEMTALFDGHRIASSQGVFFSPFIGVCIELIQGEGGIRCLSHEFATHLASFCENEKIPLIVDEIQTGVYRTGKFLASEWYGIKPDYITLGKSLGGGFAKVAALMVLETRYQPDFSLIHTSTFSEDDFSSALGLRTLEILSQDSELANRGKWFEFTVRTAIERLSLVYPGIVREIRGRGWMLGIEFDTDFNECAPYILDSFNQTGFVTLLFASYLFHRHGIRVAATLSQSQTIRIEPSTFISNEEVNQLISGISSLVEKVYQGRWVDLTSHLWSNQEALQGSQVVSPLKPSPVRPSSPMKKVVFLSHNVDLRSFRKLDPLINALSEDDSRRLLGNFDRVGKSVAYHRQEIKGRNGKTVFFELWGVSASSEFFEKSIREDNLHAYRKVKEAAETAQAEGASYLGLGQYTSIVSDNGTLLTGYLNPLRMNVTTGNSLTVGLAYRGLLSLLEKRGLKLADLRVGVVGVAGNICNVYAQILGDEARELSLIHRESYGKSPKFQAAVKTILQNSKMTEDRVRVSDDLSLLADCDVIVMGTNTARQILLPQHIRQGALVLDISVPSNIHPSVFITRPDVECFQGGHAKLPLGQKFLNPFLPCPNGEIFACMAETLAMSLMELPGHFSVGPLSKSQVFEALNMAEKVGIELGSIKKLRLI